MKVKLYEYDKKVMTVEWQKGFSTIQNSSDFFNILHHIMLEIQEKVKNNIDLDIILK